MQKKTIRDVEWQGKRALVRVDFNVPQDEQGNITDDARIQAALPTLSYLHEHGAALVLMSHLGRPKGAPNPKYSMRPVAEHLDELAAVGFEIESFGGDTFLVRAVPGVLSEQDANRVLDEILQGLAQERNIVGEELEAQLVKMVCKRASIKAGQVLSDIEMKELVRQLEACQSPRTCPHGRPTMIQLTANALEKAFKRI